MEGAAAAGAAEMAGASLVEMDAMAGASRLMVAPEVGAAAEGGLGAALEEFSAGRSVLAVEESGLIRAGSRGLARLEDDTFWAQGQEVGYLRDGFLYDVDRSTPLGRLRGTMPGRNVPLQFTEGVSTSNLRPMLVDVLRLENRRYLIRLADGSEAWVPVAALLGVVVVAANDSGECETSYGEGVVLRRTGEPIRFSQCEREDDVLTLQTADGPVVVDTDEVGEVIYGSSEVQLADAALREGTASFESIAL